MTLPSFERVNYALRPAKNVERKMLVEAFRKLIGFAPPEEYRYVGFGATHFIDFALFHRQLEMGKMVSVEIHENKRRRVEFNRPFKCIELEFGSSNEVLPRLSWNERTIAWLDYDYKLDSSVLTDAGFFSSRALSGSVLIITVDAEKEDPDGRVERLREAVGSDRVPHDVTRKVLAQEWGLAAVSRRIVENAILETLADRNGPLATGKRMRYRQLFNFRYKDGARMATFGGVFYDEMDEKILEGCRFHELSFVCAGENAYVIEVPILTHREIIRLDSQLPCSDPGMIECPGVSAEDVRRYSHVYRWFPVFVEAEL